MSPTFTSCGISDANSLMRDWNEVFFNLRYFEYVLMLILYFYLDKILYVVLLLLLK